MLPALWCHIRTVVPMREHHVDLAEHERLSEISRAVLAYLTAHRAGLHEAGDAVLEEQLQGQDRGRAFVTLLAMETDLLLARLGDEAARVHLQERGQRLGQL